MWPTPLQALLFAERCAVLSGDDFDFVLNITIDYTGARWSEVPAEFTIAVVEALECARRFVRTGAPDSDSVLFEPD